MRICSALALLLSLPFLAGCCQPKERTEPQHPGQVSGWKDDYDSDSRVHTLGEFVLRKGEATDNGKVRIKIVDVIPPDPCAHGGSWNNSARAVFQFTKVEDGKVLREEEFIDSGTNSTTGTFQIATTFVIGINIKEGWVHFQLRGVYDR